MWRISSVLVSSVSFACTSCYFGFVCVSKWVLNDVITSLTLSSNGSLFSDYEIMLPVRFSLIYGIIGVLNAVGITLSPCLG